MKDQPAFAKASAGKPVQLTEVLEMQLHSVPVVNPGVKTAPLSRGRLKLTFPISIPWWAKIIRPPSQIRKQRSLEFDPVGAEVFEMFDGERTLGEIIDEFMRRWQLSFFESRAVITEFLKRLGKRNLISYKIPAKKR